MEKYFESQQDDEQVVLVIRKHWFEMVPAIVSAGIFYLISLFVLIVLPFIFPIVIQGLFYNLYVLIVSLIFLFNTTALFSAWLMHYLNVGIITTEHIVQITQSGPFQRKLSELGLDKIQDVAAEQKGVTETMFNFGKVDVQTAGELPNFLFLRVPNPNDIAQKIMQLEEDFKKNQHQHIQTPQNTQKIDNNTEFPSNNQTL